MSLRRFAMTCAAGSAIALTLALATPAAAAAPEGPDMRPTWQGGPVSVVQPDARARDAWLRECRRRTAYYYDDGYGWHHRHHRDRHDDGHVDGLDYCEAYFDDYYRTWAQPGYGYAYPVAAYVRPMPMAMAPAPQASQPCEEVVTEEYVPVRTRIIPRRPMRRAPDKRIRVVPD